MADTKTYTLVAVASGDGESNYGRRIWSQTFTNKDEAIACHIWLNAQSDIKSKLFGLDDQSFVEAVNFIEDVTHALGFAEWSSPEHAETVLREMIDTFHPKGGNALGKVMGGTNV